ncbi:hypothetical protein O9929_23950 [Vibrio lentus]|nr:hypothetical protein [Vibrio lentus]
MTHSVRGLNHAITDETNLSGNVCRKESYDLGSTILAVAWATLCISAMLSVGEGIEQGVLKTAQMAMVI